MSAVAEFQDLFPSQQEDVSGFARLERTDFCVDAERARGVARGGLERLHGRQLGAGRELLELAMDERQRIFRGVDDVIRAGDDWNADRGRAFFETWMSPSSLPHQSKPFSSGDSHAAKMVQ